MAYNSADPPGLALMAGWQAELGRVARMGPCGGCDGEVKPATLNRSVFKLRYRHGSDCRNVDVTVGTEHMQRAESCEHDETG